MIKRKARAKNIKIKKVCPALTLDLTYNIIRKYASTPNKSENILFKKTQIFWVDLLIRTEIKLYHVDHNQLTTLYHLKSYAPVFF